MEKVKITEIIKSVNGTCVASKTSYATNISINSRTLKKGDVFFAIKGETYDGHNFIQNAILKGAVAIVTQNKNLKVSVPNIVVKNTTIALQDFARYYRNKFDITIIAITGSNGKTTTKDILSSIISQKHSVSSTQGNLNNHIGVPLTLLNINKNNKYCVLEMGANHKGEIEQLCKISNPTIGIITNIGIAHIGNFGSLKNILNAKMELFKYLRKDNTAIINNDDKLISAVAQNIKCNKVTFGIKMNSDVMGLNILPGIDKTTFYIKIKNRKEKVVLPISGMFNVYNAISAAACAISIGMPFKNIISGIECFIPQEKRMELIKLKKGITAINDSYNANPTSMRIAIENFSKIFYNKRKILVLGDMLELGKYEIREHTKLGALILKNKLADKVFTVGKLSVYTAESSKGVWCEDKDKLAVHLKNNLKPGDVILFKASRKIALETIINYLNVNIC